MQAIDHQHGKTKRLVAIDEVFGPVLRL